ncbi:MAG: sarcosine oxidase subunit delta [Alphaproteobacteria bacterium]|nr:sarcosine oxidase subunit delta [Alphaproteobacteria bacterium]
MKLLTCPMNGPRNIDEFQYLGPVRDDADPDTASDAAWARHVFRAANPPGRLLEWWRHVPTNFVFVAERDTVSNDVIRTFDPATAERP